MKGHDKNFKKKLKNYANRIANKRLTFVICEKHMQHFHHGDVFTKNSNLGEYFNFGKILNVDIL